MKRTLRLRWFVVIAGVALCSLAYAASETTTPSSSEKAGTELATSVTKITGVAISPLLGVSAVGAWQYFKTPSEKRDQMPWYARPHFWLPALLLVGAVAAKDAIGTVLPPGLKKPLDVAETVENKVSGLVATGAFVPIAASIFHSASQTSLGLSSSGLAAIDFSPLLNALTVPFAMAAFVVVWLVGHVINVLILISPFGPVDAALKSARTAVIGGLAIIHFINPWYGALLSLVVIAISILIAGWSFRLMIFGTVFTWDFISSRRKRFKPAADANWMFTARKIEKTPIRSYGKLTKVEDGKLRFDYRPWLFLAKRSVMVPAGHLAVGRGLFYPEILAVEGENAKPVLSMPPRYKKHEEGVAQIYGITDVRDTGLLKGIRAIWRWFTSNLFGRESKEAAAAAATG